MAEGDPLFYGSSMHIFIRLNQRFAVEVTPGVTGMAGCWRSGRCSHDRGDDVLTVLPGTLSEPVLVERLAIADAAVIMKLGTNFPKVRRASPPPTSPTAPSTSSAVRWPARRWCRSATSRTTRHPISR